MNPEIKDISLEIYNKLLNDETLSAYVKRYDRGISKASRKLFPYVAVGKITCVIEPLTIGRRGYINKHYSINIIGGAYSLAPRISYAGNEDGSKKGILQLSSDIVSALYPGTINDTFDWCIEVGDVSIATDENTAGNHWHCLIVIKGTRREMSSRNNA